MDLLPGLAPSTGPGKGCVSPHQQAQFALGDSRGKLVSTILLLWSLGLSTNPPTPTPMEENFFKGTDKYLRIKTNYFHHIFKSLFTSVGIVHRNRYELAERTPQSSKPGSMAPDGVKNLRWSHCESGCHVRRNSPLRLKQPCQIGV